MTNCLNDSVTATAFAPATCTNLAVGFDILGCAIDGVGDTVTLTRRDDDHIVIDNISGQPSCLSLPREPERNTATRVIMQVLQDQSCHAGFTVSIQKGIPLGSGLGGSAASSAAALVALNAFLETPLTLRELQHYALYGEELACGERHADNVFPALQGGLLLVQSIDPVNTLALPIPSFQLVLVKPEIVVETRESRKLLEAPWPLSDITRQMADLASVMAGLYTNDDAILQQHFNDHLVTPRRAVLIPGFDEVCAAAKTAGAFACSISGSGPTVFALVSATGDTATVEKAMIDAFSQHDLACQSWVSPISTQGARLVGDIT